MWNEPLDQDERDSLGPDQRVVVDHYLDEAGKVLRACERITCDPADLGTDFSYGDWDRTSFDAAHRRPPKEIQLAYRKGRSFIRLGGPKEKSKLEDSEDSCDAPIPLDEARALDAGPEDEENTLIPAN